MRKIDWSESIETAEYDKAFYLDYSISHDFPHRSLLHHYAITCDSLRYSLDSNQASNYSSLDTTFYLFCQPMVMSLKQFVERNDAEKGLGCYNALVILLRLASCLNHLQKYEIVHNDIKMDNILLRDDKNPTDICLIDFGESFIGCDQYSSSPVVKKGNVHYK